MQITSENYVERVLRTDTAITNELVGRISDPQTIRLIHAAMGMVTESAELMDMLKRHLFYGKPLDFVNGKEELGDNQWYVGLAIDVMKTTMNDILSMNIKKLQLRYPEKFCETKAIERNLDAERYLLEDEAIQKQYLKDCEQMEFGYEGVSDKEYCNMNNLRSNSDPIKYSERGKNWLSFAASVLAHIEMYTVPQYGDKGADQVTDYDCNDCVKQVQKYAARMGRNARAGQQVMDFIKMAHYTQLAYEKHMEEENAIIEP